MTWKTRAAYRFLGAAALFAAFGAGYRVRAQTDTRWEYPKGLNALAKPQALVRTADGQLVSGLGRGGARTYKPDLRPYETYDEVRRAIHENFVRRDVDDTQITYGAIRGMLRSLGDRFTRYLTPEEFDKFNQETNAEFVGIGARIELKDDYIGSLQAKPLNASRPYIVEPMPNSPAYKAGLQKGDVLLAIDGRSTADQNLDIVVKAIQGKRGSTVILKVERNIAGDKESARDATRDAAYKVFDLPITRDLIEVHPVTLEWLPDRIAWLKLDEFNKKSEVEMSKALKSLQKGPDGQGPANGLILDMRDNPGGLLDSAVDIGSHFIPSGPIVYTRERNGRELPLNAEKNLFLGLKMPVVVLINNYSASAAEIVTGALKDKNAATVVGETSFGKASVQVLVELKNGGALVITTAKYLTPGKHDISDKGIAPDIQVKASAEDDKTGRGAQLQKAVSLIEQKNTGTTATVAARPQ